LQDGLNAVKPIRFSKPWVSLCSTHPTIHFNPAPKLCNHGA
jgi:hypothetical protein